MAIVMIQRRKSLLKLDEIILFTMFNLPSITQFDMIIELEIRLSLI